MKKVTLIVAAFMISAIGAFALVPATSVGALDPLANACADNPDSEICKNKDEDASSLIGTIINVLLFLVGTLSVIMIIVSGIFYVTSSGDSSKVARAKNTLLYSVVGLVISFIAFAVVNWVLKLF